MKSDTFTASTEDEITYLKQHLSDTHWRLNNLYYIRDEKGQKVKFQMNEVQEELFQNIWYMNVIPKARQLGMCLDPDTKVLRADMTWERIGDMRPGTEIVSVDEYAFGKHKARRMKKGFVEGVVKFKRKRYRISFDDGSSIICTGKHPWLSREEGVSWDWRCIEGESGKNGKLKRLKVGTKIRRIVKETLSNEHSYEDEWIGGMLDGEGSFSNKNGNYVAITGIEYLGEGEVVDLQTSAGTYIAEGLVSHNTTFFTIFYLDQVLFSENKIAGIIAHRQEDMKRIFRGKIVFAWQHMHPWLRRYFGEPVIDTANELVWPNGGGIFVSMTTRSQTPNFLHISEYGYICAHYPERAEEVRSGAFNSVHAGQMISVESTAEGREGHFYKLVMNAKKMQDENKKLTPLDFRLHFFPWWRDNRYRIPLEGKPEFSKEDDEYFQKLLENHGISLDDEQKLWYIKKRNMNEGNMMSQFPSTLEEAFSVSLEGAYYKKEMERVYKEGRVGFFPHDPRYPVNTVWDLGMNDTMVVVFFQFINAEIRFVNVYWNQGEGLKHYVEQLRQYEYRYGFHILPWDSQVRDLSAAGTSREQILWELGLRDTRVAPKLSIQDGIEKVRLMFGRFRFHEKTTLRLIDALQNYRKEWDKGGATWKNQPLHDESSHFADAIRNMALALHDADAEGNTQEGNDIHIESFFG